MPGKPSLSATLGRVLAGDPLSADDENLLRALATRTVDLADSLTDSSGTRQAVPDVDPEEELYWCMLMEDHPGRGVCFGVIVGEYCEDEGKYRFDCNETDFETAIDWHYAGPQPATYAQGWFKRKPYKWTESGYIYLRVTLDCESDGSCANHALTNGECPDQLTDPCV